MKNCPTILDLTSDEDLLAELGNRFEHYIFVGSRICEVKGTEKTEEWCGDEDYCKGLAISMIDKIREDCAIIRGDYEEEEEDDD